MVTGGGGDGKIPAGYTYLGQFVDHDLTMDPSEAAARGRGLPRRDGPEPVAAPGPRLAVRRRTRQPRIGEALRGRRAAPEGRYDDPGRGREGQEGARPPPRRQGRPVSEPEGADRGPAQRREPDRGADPPGDDQLPQQGRLQGPGEPPAGAALQPGPPAGDPALPVDAAPRLPAADLPALGGQRRVQERPQAGRARRRTDRHPDDAAGVLGRGVPAGPQHDPHASTTGTPSSPATSGAWTGCSSSPRSAATSAGRSG